MILAVTDAIIQNMIGKSASQVSFSTIGFGAVKNIITRDLIFDFVAVQADELRKYQIERNKQRIRNLSV